MKNFKVFTFCIAVLAMAYSFSFLKTVKVDPSASTVTWAGHKVTGSHEGTIDLKSGSFELENNQITGGSFILDMTSIKNTDLSFGQGRSLVGHLKSDDFFSVKTYPTAQFVVTESTPAKMERSFNITGDLTIKGTTHPISFVAQLETTKKGVVCTAQLKVDRTLYDVKYGSGKFFSDLGDKMIDDEFDINIRLISE